MSDKLRLLCATVLASAAAWQAAWAGPPELAEPVKIESGGSPIDVELGDLVPVIVDWDCDGKKDLIAGQYKDGKIRFYRNVGEDAAPKFDGFIFLKAGGEEISLSFC